MKIFLLVALIVSGMLSTGGESQDHTGFEPVAVSPGHVEADQAAPSEVTEPHEWPSGEAAYYPEEESSVVQTVDQDEAAWGAEEGILLRSVQELTLYDDRAAVIGKLGEPRGVTQDEFYSDLVIMEYEDLRVVFAGEYIQAIDIPGDAKKILLDDVTVPMTVADLKAVLGEPDYIAEDGIVFQRDEALLKLFLDEETGELAYISYYHLATV
ncbi:hypothetical protein B1748_19800 [Paenibacillus sp. MY03]|jgi:hypothetical protein|uniref:hypothetical protein n=1 Tax=Paenibacillus sp. MY03 TaxID=302980 RepID=UPI000B3C34CD|nr:hypothetical protein [Paenibacillus sp. MY03]OUS74967.1 hypothetical protein B1748_19800 [Paenibacillus sp. MY03]